MSKRSLKRLGRGEERKKWASHGSAVIECLPSTYRLDSSSSREKKLLGTPNIINWMHIIVRFHMGIFNHKIISFKAKDKFVNQEHKTREVRRGAEVQNAAVDIKSGEVSQHGIKKRKRGGGRWKVEGQPEAGAMRV